MSARSPVKAFLAAQARRRAGDLALAIGGAAGAAAAGTLLLGLSGWFLAGAALAGAAGSVAVQAFNYLLPSAGLRGLAIARTVGRYGERLFSHRAALHALAELRPALFASLASAPGRQALELSSGEASARLVQDVEALETHFVRRPAPWTAAAAAAAAALVTLAASPWAAAAFLAGAAALAGAGPILTRRIAGTGGDDRLLAAGRLKERLAAYLPATAELRCFDLTPRATRALMAEDAALAEASLAQARAEGRLLLLEAAIGVATVAAVAALSADAGLPLAALAVLATLAGLEGVSAPLRAAEHDEAQAAAVVRLDAMLGEARPPRAEPPAGRVLEIDGLPLKPGDRLAVTGPSGAGKTSLLEALLGLRDAPAGRIRVDGHPLEGAQEGWARPLFAYAPQDARLITGTVADNLRLAAPQADDAALWATLEDARLDDRVRRLDGGLTAWLGDGGEILSGGEQRRLALARALLRPAPWLLLDEPTEGLDRAMEAEIVERLAKRLARTGQGLILVSHRPAPLALCDLRLETGAPQAQPES